ncbi:MAG: CAP domain-containing protein [Bacilli bacterium]|nr:CAP domain-containing protein [Bacilli bacterium]
MKKSEKKVKISQKKLVIIICVITLILGGSGTVGYFIWKDKKDIPKTENNKNIEDALSVKESLTINVYDEVPGGYKFFNEDPKILIDEDFIGLPIETIDGKKFASEVGEYFVSLKIKDKEYSSKLLVIDKTSPKLKLKEVTIKEKESYNLNDFIDNCSDNSKKDCILKFLDDKMASYTKSGSYDIEIVASDKYGNETSKETKLIIKKVNTSSKEESKNIENENTESKDTSSKEENNIITSNPKEDTKTEVTYEVKQEVTEEEKVKYGAVLTTTNKTKYKVYSDGTKEKLSSSSSVSYDKRGFNATTDELKTEATSLVSKYSNEINQVLSKVNEYRAEVGKPALVLDKNLSVAATIRALELGYSDEFSHDRPNGSSCFTVLNEIGYTAYAAGENIASGYKTSADVSQGWKDSQGHYENMIADEFGKIGIGLVKTDHYYWVQMFSD